MKQVLGYAATAAFAFLLVAGGTAGALALAEDVEGKVAAYEKGKSIELEVGAEKKKYAVNDETEIKGEIEVGKSVKLSEKEGVATKIEVKE